MAADAARIMSPKRYISLLSQEEKRLKWLSASSQLTSGQKSEAAINLEQITNKLYKAESELVNLEGMRKRRMN